MKERFKAWVAALGCSALVLIMPARSIAETSSKDTMQQEIVKRQILMTDGARQVMYGSKEMQEALKTLIGAKDQAKARKAVTKAEKTVADGEEMLADAQTIEANLIRELKRTSEADRRIIEGAMLVQRGMLLMTKDQRGLSRAQEMVKEGNTMLERGQQIVSADQT